MKTITTKSILIKDILKDISSALDVTITQNWEEYSLKIPASWGKGSISGITLNDGMSLLQYDCTFNDDIQLHFTKPSDYPMILNYCLLGGLQARFNHMDDFVSVEQYQSLILVNQDDKGYILQFKKGDKIKARSILIARKEFREKFLPEDQVLEPHYEELFNGIGEQDSFYQNHMYSVILSHYFDLIDGSDMKGLVRALRIKGLALQILSEQLNLYEDELKDNGVQGILRQYEIACIQDAANIIDEELEELASIPEIARRVGINSNKLQDGFKLIYKNTVNGYVQDIRMKRAAYLLHYSDFSVSEIVTKVGLNSKSYFSKIFKEEYSITPSDYRRKKQDGKRGHSQDGEQDGKQDGKPGYSQDGKLEFSQDGKQDGEPGYSQYGKQDGKPGYSQDGEQDGKPGYSQDGEQDGKQDGKPGYSQDGEQDGKPGFSQDGEQDGKPGFSQDGEQDGKPGYSQDGEQDGKLGFSQDGKQDGEQDGKLGFSQDGKPGYSQDGKLDGKPGW